MLVGLSLSYPSLLPFFHFQGPELESWHCREDPEQGEGQRDAILTGKDTHTKKKGWPDGTFKLYERNKFSFKHVMGRVIRLSHKGHKFFF